MALFIFVGAAARGAMGGGTYMFVIVGDGDQPLYEAEFPSNPTNRVRPPCSVHAVRSRRTP